MIEGEPTISPPPSKDIIAGDPTDGEDRIVDHT